MIIVLNDGTIDTVLRCTECGKVFRHHHDLLYENPPWIQEENHQNWVENLIKDMTIDHDCPKQQN